MKYKLLRAAVDSLGDEKQLNDNMRQYLFMAALGVHIIDMMKTMDCGEQTPKKKLHTLYQIFDVQSRHELTGLVIKRMEEIAF